MTSIKLRSVGESRAVLLICVAIVTGTLMDVLIKLVGGEVPTWQLLFLRWAFNGVLLMPFVLYQGWEAVRWHKPGVHLIRALLTVFGSFLLFYALAHQPLGLTISLFFTEPLFVLPMAALLLRERVGMANWLAALVGFSGVLLVANPFADMAKGVNWFTLLSVMGAIGFAASQVITKGYGQQESTLGLIFWLSVLTAAATAPMAWHSWQPLSNEQWGLIWLLTLAGCAYNLLWLMALRCGSMATIANLSYLSLPLAFAVGWWLFAEVPQLSTLIGSAVILLAVVAVGRHNVLQARRLASLDEEHLQEALLEADPLTPVQQKSV
ncbi:DMT family transporter [Balneatrix alpica]|uniref:DMT family transporter n=1 Tax=Balneatrix alpica TaxID=75684 RepID=A0ABV5ZC38_9GAMM|nr:DMT family transporter [Balneatrix alpica]